MMRSPYRRSRNKDRNKKSKDRFTWLDPRRGSLTRSESKELAIIEKQLDQVGEFTSVIPSVSNRGESPKLGSRDLLAAFSTMPWLHAVVGKISQAVGLTDWQVFVKSDSTSKQAIKARWAKLPSYDARRLHIRKDEKIGSLEELEDHPILTFLDSGNHILLGQNILQLTDQYISLVGEAFWVIERDALGIPIAPWPVPPHWVTNLPSVEMPWYTIRFNNKTANVPISEVIPFLRPDPLNPYGRGSGIAKSLGDELETDEFAAKHTKAFFYNKARPDIIISGEGLGRGDTKRMEEMWLKKYEGFWNSYKPYFMNKKVEIQQLTQDFESMQLVQLRKFERDMVMQVMGVSPEKFGVLSASNRSTIAAADVFWSKDVIKPRVELIRNTLQQKLVPLFDERLILDFESLVVEDKELELKVMVAQPAAFTINEWREQANKPSLGEDGERQIYRPGEISVPVGELPPTNSSESAILLLHTRMKEALREKVKEGVEKAIKENPLLSLTKVEPKK